MGPFYMPISAPRWDHFGCLFPAAARIVSGTVYAFDIEAGMVGRTQARAQLEGLHNVNPPVA